MPSDFQFTLQSHSFPVHTVHTWKLTSNTSHFEFIVFVMSQNQSIQSIAVYTQPITFKLYEKFERGTTQAANQDASVLKAQ